MKLAKPKGRIGTTRCLDSYSVGHLPRNGGHRQRQPTTGQASPCPHVAIAQHPSPRPAVRRTVSTRATPASATASPEVGFKSQTELLLEELAGEAPEIEAGDEPQDTTQQMSDQYTALKAQAAALGKEIDQLYNAAFAGLAIEVPVTAQEGAESGDEAASEAESSTTTVVYDRMTEAGFGALGREEPQVMAALLAAKQAKDPEGWTAFQSQVGQLKLQRGRIEREADSLFNAMQDAMRTAAAREADRARRELEERRLGETAGAQGPLQAAPGTKPVRIVLVTGFEQFNNDLYKQVAQRVQAVAPHISLQVFSDRDLSTARAKERVEAALKNADVFFASLLFDYDSVEWLRTHISHIPVRCIFESALELMSCTQVGSFTMAPGGGGQQGPPPVVKKVLSLFGSKREEDKMVGYLSFLKVGPKLLKFLPGKKAADLKAWLTIYSYWNQGGLANVTSMFLYLVDSLVEPLPAARTASGQTAASAAALIAPPVETPALGCLHPSYNDGREFFTSPAQYWAWYLKEGPLRAEVGVAPVVGVLLYRKHVITEQPYIMQLIERMEQEGLIPVPVFINGVEAHTVVRDLLTTASEQRDLARGNVGGISPTLARDAVRVDAVVSTIGFPLVGGPAGSMEGGRQADIAKSILQSKNVPYVIAAPLLIQDIEGWMRDGVAGLQSVVLYSLPELDGAIDTVPLGGLVGNNIFLVPERVTKMARRIKAWVTLRRKPPSERRVAILLYGFPPGVGAVGTAALLNVPRSLENVIGNLASAGYDLGDVKHRLPELLTQLEGGSTGYVIKREGSGAASGGAQGEVEASQQAQGVSMGEAMIAALAAQDQERVRARGAKGVSALGVGDASAAGWHASASEVNFEQLKSWLTYPPEWGPTEWGPIPFLPDNDVLVKNMERQWGELRSYRGLMSVGTGRVLVPGIQSGNVFVGVQPVLGVEGDPMRLLFERDLTPHPQYAAFYKWLQNDYKADVVLHFGMHGTVEWLPGAPLGNTGLSWSDILLGEMPNVYVYAANNPSESIIAKRRGYGTIVSHNVPPYGRAGLYKQLATLKDLLTEQREQRGSMKSPATTAEQSHTDSAAPPAAGSSTTGHTSDSMRETIFSNIELAGLTEDVPFFPAQESHLWEVAEQARAAAEALATPSPAAKPKSSSSGSPLGARRSPTPSRRRGRGPPPPPLGKPVLLSQPSPGPKVTVSSGPPPGSLPLTTELVMAMSDDEWAKYSSDVYNYLMVLENRLFSEGLHILGQPPSTSALSQYLSAYFDNALPQEAVDMIAESGDGVSVEAVKARLERSWALTSAKGAEASVSGTASQSHDDTQRTLDPEQLTQNIDQAIKIRSLLARNTEEMTNLLRALGGEYVPPEAGGDLLRDGPGVLPTGRNIHALDPYRMPSPTAMERGAIAAQAILDSHRAANNGEYPETVAINLWGLDAIKTKGESVGMVLHMVGAVPVREGTGRIARYELLPLDELGGRPRVDCLCNMSGIFRDSFQNVVELLDDLFARAAEADEPSDKNYVRKHALSMKAQGMQATSARLFSNPAGDYGSMVNERVGAGNWENGDELADTWVSRNAFSYGRGGERGAARPEVLKSLLSTTSRIVQQIDSVEYGMTDIQEYYANTGALARAAQMANGQQKVGVSIVEAFGKDVKPKELDNVLRLEYRSKLLNPKWAEAMVSQGSGGAYEISQRMTAMIGWGGTTGFAEDWAWDQAAQTYALDPEMAAKLRDANPRAFSNLLRRCIEASGRGMWKATPQVLAKLKSLYSEMDDKLEGV